MKCKQAVAGAVVALASSTALADGFSGNVGAVSTYMFRGVDQTLGAAVQGGVDYSFDFGLYSGLWISNSLAGGGNEADAYVGYGLTLGGFGLDGGIIYYGYSEDTEALSAANTDYAELYVGAGFDPIAVKIFYTNEFGRDTGGAVTGDPEKNDLLYVTASATLNYGDTLSFVPQVGFSSGDGVKDAFGDEYTDFSFTAIKKLDDDFTASLALIGTDRELPAGSDNADNAKFVVGLRKAFNI
jgi:uncharacterized protein (TIGR02001 family)